MPSLRERKRYLTFEIISERPIEDVKSVKKAFSAKALELLGTLGCAQAGMMVLEDQYKNRKGVIRVSHKHLDRARATLAAIDMIDDQEVIVRSIGASGMIRKAISLAA